MEFSQILPCAYIRMQLLLFLLVIFIGCFFVYPMLEAFGDGLWMTNMSTRHTRNMSYDLRGDPFVIPVNVGLSPWGMSDRI